MRTLLLLSLIAPLLYADPFITFGVGKNQTSNDEVLANEDLGRIDFADPGITETVFDGSDFITGKGFGKINDVHFNNDGSILLALQNTKDIGGIRPDKDDIVLFDQDANTASVFFNGSDFFDNSEVIDAFTVLSNGDILLSTKGTASIDGEKFQKDDLVRINTETGEFEVIDLTDVIIGKGSNIDAVSVLSNGDVVISTSKQVTIDGVTFDNNDLIQLNLDDLTASLFFDLGQILDGNGDITALFIQEVPEPSQIFILLLGFLLLGFRRYKSKE